MSSTDENDKTTKIEGTVLGHSSTSSQGYTAWEFHEPKLVEPREDRTVEEAKAIMDDFYNSGKPFFTKAAIRDLYEQMQTHTNAGDKIITKDITGAELEWKVRIGEKGLCWKKASPLAGLGVGYAEYTHMKSNLEWQGSTMRSIYAPLTLQHQVIGLDLGRKCHCDCACEEDSKEDTEDVQEIDACSLREKVGIAFREKLALWEQSETCRNFKSVLRSFASEHDINKIVGLSCGSLCLPNNKAVTEQTAVLVSVRNWLKEESEENVPCFIQDPMNTPLDKEVLNDIGFEMIDDPRGWLEIDERSVVLSVGSNVPVKAIVADTARPAIVIWDRVPDKDSASTDPVTSRVRQMMEEYDAYEFEPEGIDAVIYIRKSKVPPVANEDGTFGVFRPEKESEKEFEKESENE